MSVKKNKYDITVKTNASFEEAMKAIATAPKAVVDKAIRATTPKQAKPKAK